MQSAIRISRNVICWSVLGLALFLNQACKDDDKGTKVPAPGDTRVQLPASTQMVLSLDKDGKVIVLDPSGQPVPSCGMCTPELEKKYGKLCNEAAAAKVNICSALTGVTVHDVNTVTIVNTHKSPPCGCITTGGSTYCLPRGCGAITQ